jgi:cytochrome c biogenesis protein CcdA
MCDIRGNFILFACAWSFPKTSFHFSGSWARLLNSRKYITEIEYVDAAVSAMSLDVSAGGAFVAGLLSFVSPCVLPLVPPSLAYMGGVSTDQLGNEGAVKTGGRVLLAAVCFVPGILIFTGQMPTIAFWLIEAFPALGKTG